MAEAEEEVASHWLEDIKGKNIEDPDDQEKDRISNFQSVLHEKSCIGVDVNFNPSSLTLLTLGCRLNTSQKKSFRHDDQSHAKLFKALDLVLYKLSSVS